MFSNNLGLRLVEILLLTLALVQLFKILQSTLPILIKTFSSNPSSIHSTKSFLIPSIVAHARFLPRKSKHKFTYPALFITTELNALENARLDLGRWFTWNGNRHRWSILSLIPDEYLRLKFPQLEQKWNGKLDQDDEIILHDKDQDPITPQSQRLRGSILLKLVYELRSRGFLNSGPQDDDWGDDQETNPDKNHHHRGWRSELGQVWSLTMPSIFGFQGINPLTVYYCYRPYGYKDQTSKSTDDNNNHDLSSSSSSDKRGPFWLTVLEVHNTFSERHVYILESNVDEDREESSFGRRKGYQHQWTFERSFHVSPFNDRGGYYCLMMDDLFGSGKDGVEDTRLIDDRTRENDKVGEKEKEVAVEIPRIDIRLLLLVHSSSQDSSNIKSSNLESSSNSDSNSTSSQSSSSSPTSSSNPSSSSNSNSTSTLNQSSSDLKSSTSTTTPRLQKKLLATLQSHPSNHSKRPGSLSPQSIFQSLSRQPLDLFLTTFRILWEAGKLHFGKRLDAFARPDMMQRKEAAEMKVRDGDGDEFDGIGLPPVLNAVESVRNQKSKSMQKGKGKKNEKENFGGLLWPQESWIEKIAREAFLRFSSVKLNSDLGSSSNVKSLKIVSTDEAVEDISIQSKPQDQISKENQELKIFIRSPAFYTDLLLYPTPGLALLFGSRIGRRWGVSDVEKFRDFFLNGDDVDSTRKSSDQDRKDWKLKATNRIRVRHLNFCLNLIHQSGYEKKSQEMKAILLNELSTATSPSNESQPQSKKLRTKDLPPHPLDKTSISLNLLISLFLLHLATIVEYHLFNLLGARYVENTEPWLEISRGLELLSREKRREKLEESWDLLEDVSEDAGKDIKGVRKEKVKLGEKRRDKPVWLELGSVRRE